MPKPAFDPNAAFEAVAEKTEKPAFDPNAPFKSQDGGGTGGDFVPMDLPEAPPMPSAEEMRFGKVKMNPYESALFGGAQGVTAGFADEGAAALKAALVSPFSEKNFGELRQEYLDEIRYLTNEAAKQNPKTAILAEVGGAIASPLNKLTKPVQGVGFLANAGKAALAGATIAAGKSEANPFTSKKKASEFRRDVALGAVAGPVVEGVMGLIGKGSKALMPQALNTFAEKAAKKIGAEEAGDYLGGLALGGVAGALLDPSENKAESALKGVGMSLGYKYLNKQIPVLQSVGARNLAKLTSMGLPNQLLRAGEQLPFTPARNAALQWGYSGAEE